MPLLRTDAEARRAGQFPGQDEQSRIVLPPETGEQPSLSSGLGDALWLNPTPPPPPPRAPP